MTDPAARPHGTDARAARPVAGGQRPALGGLWLLAVPLACCGGPLLIRSLAAAGALVWGALGLGAGVLVAGHGPGHPPQARLRLRRARHDRLGPGKAGRRLPGGQRRDEHS